MANSLDEKTKQDILDSVTKYAEEIATIIPLIAKEPGSLINTASGIPRWNNSAIKKFKMIYEMPEPFASMPDPLLKDSKYHYSRIQCCLCHKPIKYPCWYYVNKFVRNEFHYFVCSSIPDGIRDDKVSTRCTRK